MTEVHDMEMTCVGDVHPGGDGFMHLAECSFECRVKAESHEEGLRQAAELHKQQREEQSRLREEAGKQNEGRMFPMLDDELPQVTICEKFEPWVYPAPCWECFWRDCPSMKRFEEDMARAMAFFANFAINGMPGTTH